MTTRQLISSAVLAAWGIALLTTFQNCAPVKANIKVSEGSLVNGFNDPELPPVDDKQYKNAGQYFTVNETKKVDVVVIIDNSGSMQTEQQNMAARFSSFITELKGLDWNLGVMTTDLSADEELKDARLIKFDAVGSYKLSSALPQATAESAFASVIQRPETGNSKEQGVKGTYRLLERFTDTNAVNDRTRDLLRADSALAVVVVTDANETPDTANDSRNNPDNLIAKVKSVFGSKKLFRFNSIIVKSGDSVCRAKDGNEGYGTVYESLSTKTGGLIGSVCETDYGSQLKNLGQATYDLIKQVKLTCAPVDSDNDGEKDIAVRDAAGVLLTNYVLKNDEITFNNPPGVGTYQISYNCLK